jgi:hypothetical protein
MLPTSLALSMSRETYLFGWLHSLLPFSFLVRETFYQELPFREKPASFSFRLQRAVNALADSSMTVILTRQTEAEIRALVRNGEGKEYGVTLPPQTRQRGSPCQIQEAEAF